MSLFGGIPAFGGHSLGGSIERSATLTAKGSRHDIESETFFVVSTLDASYGRLQGCSGQDANHGHSHLVVHGTQDPDVCIDHTHTLGRNSGQENALLCRDVPHAIQGGAAVRRLLPRECERLQGFSDDYTLIPWRGKPAEECPDGPRYKAIGNSKAVPVVAWIGRRLQRALGSLSEDFA
ncbi:Modification methylase HpaII [compost metagenome]